MTTANQAFQFERCGRILILVPAHDLMDFRDADIRNSYNDAYRLIGTSDYDHLVIDFSELDHFGSTFVGIMIRLARKARQHGGEAVLCNLNDNLKGILKTLMLLENAQAGFFWKPFESREAAIKSLQQLT